MFEIKAIGLFGSYLEVPQKWNKAINLHKLVNHNIKVRFNPNKAHRKFKVIRVISPTYPDGDFVPACHKLFVAEY